MSGAAAHSLAIVVASARSIADDRRNNESSTLPGTLPSRAARASAREASGSGNGLQDPLEVVALEDVVGARVGAYSVDQLTRLSQMPCGTGLVPRLTESGPQ